MRFEITMDSETVTSYEEVLRILETLGTLQAVTTDEGLLHDLKETFSHYEGIKDDMLIEISNHLGLQFETTVKMTL